MMRPIVCALLLIHAVPLTSADWVVMGDAEPDPHDSLAFIWAKPGGEVPRIYFNAILTPAYSGTNPNVGIIGSRLMIPGLQSATAWLGVWRDCNRDGHIGALETAVSEYRSEALLDRSLCPPDASNHNRGGWVFEFLWIGWGDNAANPRGVAPRLIHDPGAAVWGDAGLLGDEVGVGCPIGTPRGTFASTGGVIAYADCYGRRGLLTAVNTVGNPIGVDLDFENEEFPQCSASLLNQPIGIFYRDPRCPAAPGLLEPNTARPVVAWDCGEPVPPTGPVVVTPPINPRIQSGSAYDTASATVALASAGCTSNGGGSILDPYYRSLLIEQDVTAGMLAKRESTFPFQFHNARSTSFTGRVLEEPDAPANYGLTALNGISHERAGPSWASDQSRSDGSVARDDLTLVGHSYYTFYARVGIASLRIAQTPGGSGEYGAEACAGIIFGVRNGWDCDPSHWWNEEYGSSGMPRTTWSDTPYGVRPGTPYQLRDVDCVDNALWPDAGLHAGIGILTAEGPCP